MMKFYAVARGRNPGIYTSWPEAEKEVRGFSGPVFKSFKTLKDAEAFMENPTYKPRAGKARRSTPSSRITIPDDAVIVYTDGGAIGNPGPGGYGVVIKDFKELSGGYNLTTNNRMELKAVIIALEALRGMSRPIFLHSDSQYVINGITKGWAEKWRANNWIKPSDKKPAINADLWAVLLDLLEDLDVTFCWVKGHAGNPLNERCDKLANGTARQENLPDDEAYLASLK